MNQKKQRTLRRWAHHGMAAGLIPLCAASAMGQCNEEKLAIPFAGDHVALQNDSLVGAGILTTGSFRRDGMSWTDNGAWLGASDVDLGQDGQTLAIARAGNSVEYRVRSGNTWNFSATVTDQAGTGSSTFATSAALSSGSEEWMFVGEPGEDQVQIFRSLLGLWFLDQVVAGVSGSDFGHAVAACGDYLVVGAPLDDTAITNGGSATFYEYNGSAWVEMNTINYGNAGAQFGYDVDIGLNTADGVEHAVIGGPFDSTFGVNGGAAWFYVNTGLTSTPSPATDSSITTTWATRLRLMTVWRSPVAPAFPAAELPPAPLIVGNGTAFSMLLPIPLLLVIPAPATNLVEQSVFGEPIWPWVPRALMRCIPTATEAFTMTSAFLCPASSIQYFMAAAALALTTTIRSI